MERNGLSLLTVKKLNDATLFPVILMLSKKKNGTLSCEINWLITKDRDQ